MGELVRWHRTRPGFLARRTGHPASTVQGARYPQAHAEDPFWGDTAAFNGLLDHVCSNIEIVARRLLLGQGCDQFDQRALCEVAEDDPYLVVAERDTDRATRTWLYAEEPPWPAHRTLFPGHAPSVKVGD